MADVQLLLDVVKVLDERKLTIDQHVLKIKQVAELRQKVRQQLEKVIASQVFFFFISLQAQYFPHLSLNISHTYYMYVCIVADATNFKKPFSQ